MSEQVSDTKEIVSQEVVEPVVSSNTQEASIPEATIAGEQPETPTFVPNFKVKVMDKEHEIDEFLRPAIKDADAEKKVRELYEKAYGLDVVKASKHQVSEELRTIKNDHGTLVSELQGLGKAIQSEDLDTAFEQLRIKPDAVFKWARKKIQEMELPEDQRRMLEQSREAQKRLQDVEKQNQYLSETYHSSLVQARVNDVQATVQSPDYSSYAAQFDARAGKQGAFELEVLRRGAMANSEGRDPHPKELASEIVKLYGLQGMTQTPMAPASAQKVPTIPNVSGGGSSPAKSRVRSIDELRKLSSSMD